METIFDHNVTKEEQANLYGVPMDADMYKRGMSEDKAYEHLYYLFLSRGDTKQAKRVLGKILNGVDKTFSILNVDHVGFKYLRGF